MPGSNPLPLMYEHNLIPVKAFNWIHGLTKTAPLANRADTSLVMGRVMYLNSTGKFTRGLAANQVPHFNYRPQSAGDVTGYVGEGQDEIISGIVGLAGYEIQSTEFMTGTYNPNAMLTAVDAGGAAADMGKLKAGTLGTDTICGIVSDGLSTNVDKIGVLQFWTAFLPVYPGA